MRKKKIKVAFPKEVRITREGVYAHVDFIDTSYASRIEIGPEVASMSDTDILRLHNEIVLSAQRCITESKEDAPQIKFDQHHQSWTPLSDVLRCEIISDSGTDEPVINIDDEELSWEEFGRMVKSYNGWGLRVMFLPPEQLFNPPPVQVISKPIKNP